MPKKIKQFYLRIMKRLALWLYTKYWGKWYRISFRPNSIYINGKKSAEWKTLENQRLTIWARTPANLEKYN